MENFYVPTSCFLKFNLLSYFITRYQHDFVLRFLFRASILPSHFEEVLFILSNLIKLELVALDITNKNYLLWTLDAEIHLDAMKLVNTIKQENQELMQNRGKAMILLRHQIYTKG